MDALWIINMDRWMEGEGGKEGRINKWKDWWLQLCTHESYVSYLIVKTVSFIGMYRQNIPENRSLSIHRVLSVYNLGFI